MPSAPAPPPAATITGHVPGSFPWSVFHDRHPRLFRQLRDAVPYGPDQIENLRLLERETLTGPITRLTDDAPDRADWDESGRDFYGRPWTDAPFLWAESYFYRRLLAATGYFTPGTWFGLDPFGPLKDAELRSPDVDRELARYDQIATLPGPDQDKAILSLCLWGNRADLGFQLIAGRTDDPAGNLLVDDTDTLRAHLRDHAPGTVNLIADNAARELIPDLMLLDHLLNNGLAARAVLHLKPRPYYVSDATTTDACAALRRLADAPGSAGEAGRRLWQAGATGRLTLTADDFFCSPRTFHDFPAALRAQFADATMTFVKGDLNFRRLLGDRHWPPTTPFADLTGYFPGPVTALRTCKSEVAVGLPAETVSALAAADPDWRFSGAHAVIQTRIPD